MRTSSDGAAAHGPHCTGEPGLGAAMTARPSTRWPQPATSSTVMAGARTPIFRLMAPHAAMNPRRPRRTETRLRRDRSRARLLGRLEQLVERDVEVVGEIPQVGQQFGARDNPDVELAVQ